MGQRALQSPEARISPTTRRLPKTLTFLLLFGWLMTTALGQTLSFTLDTTENRAAEAQAIAAQLQQSGVDSDVRAWQSAVLTEEMQAGNFDGRLGLCLLRPL